MKIGEAALGFRLSDYGPITTRRASTWRLARARTRTRSADCWLWLRSTTEPRVRRPPRSAASHGRSFGFGCCGKMRAGRKACSTARLRGNRRCSTTRTGRHWLRRSTAVRFPPSTAWSAGASSICASGCGRVSGRASPSRPSVANCARCAFASYRHARATMPRLRAPSRHLKNVWPAPSASDFCNLI